MSALTRWGFDRKAGGPKRPVPLVRAYTGPWPILAHRTMAQVIAEEEQEAGPRIKSGVTEKDKDCASRRRGSAGALTSKQCRSQAGEKERPGAGVGQSSAKGEQKARTPIEYRAKAGDEAQGGRMRDPCVEPVSRPAAGRAAAATSEFMDVTAGETATELSERLDGFASVQDGLCQMSTNGALPAGTETPAARTPALRGVTAGETAPVSDPVEATPPKQVSAPVADMAALPLVAPTQPPPARAPILPKTPEPRHPKAGLREYFPADDAVVEVRKAPAPVDWSRVADAAKSRKVAPPAPKPRPTRVALSREACSRCGVPGWRGCDHQLPFEDTP